MTEPQPTYEVNGQIFLPRPAIKLAYRMLNELKTRDIAQVVIMVVDGLWCVSVNGGEIERLG